VNVEAGSVLRTVVDITLVGCRSIWQTRNLEVLHFQRPEWMNWRYMHGESSCCFHGLINKKRFILSHLQSEVGHSSDEGSCGKVVSGEQKGVGLVILAYNLFPRSMEAALLTRTH
jgi:hypothetical protein